MTTRIPRILIIRCGLLGDTIDSTAVVRPLVEYYGNDLQIEWLIKPHLKDLFKYDSRISPLVLRFTKLPLLFNFGKLKMIEMDIYVNQNLINKHRSDGVIVSSPTGSTAYAMSNGCPIVSPQSNVICIVPIAPHSYGQRSVIINNSDTITIKVNKKSVENSQVTFGGANNLTIKNPKDIFIKKASRQLQIIHPCDYDYFNVLSKKLRYDIKS